MCVRVGDPGSRPLPSTRCDVVLRFMLSVAFAENLDDNLDLWDETPDILDDVIRPWPGAQPAQASATPAPKVEPETWRRGTHSLCQQKQPTKSAPWHPQGLGTDQHGTGSLEERSATK